MERNNIPAIHNYCDRWCERCAFTARCAVFEMNQDLPPGAEDPENEAFWETLSNRFTESLHLLQEGCERHGIVLEEPTEEEYAVYAQQQEDVERQVAGTPVIQAAHEYAKTVDLLFTQSDLWKHKGEALAQETTLGIKSVDKGMTEVELLEDCQHVIRWYQYFIEVKFRRAVQGLHGDDPDHLDPQGDANGTAKVALLAVERSRLALTSLLSLAGEDDTVLDLLALLDRIGREGRAMFPGSASFQRPGFDDVSEN